MVEERKLIKLGNSSFAIALPKVWIEKSGLKKGDKISIVPNSNGELIIMADYQKRNGEENKKIVIDSSGLDDYFLKRNVISAYVKGYNSISISGENKKVKDSAKKIFDNLLSFEIINSENGEIEAKDFFDITNSSINNFMKRIDNNIREMFSILSNLKGDSLQKKKKDLEEIDRDINKFYLLISRTMIMGMNNPAVLNTLKTDPVTLFRNWWFAFNLEHLGDKLKSIAELVSQEKDREVLLLLPELCNFYVDSSDGFHKLDKDKTKKALKKSIDLKVIIDKIENNSKGNLKLLIKLSEIRNSIYQNSKITLYLDI